MAKILTTLTQAGPIVAPVAAKTTLVNASPGMLFVTTPDIDKALEPLSLMEKNAVLNALYAIKPGGYQSLQAGTYSVAFSSKLSMSAVLLVETKA